MRRFAFYAAFALQVLAGIGLAVVGAARAALTSGYTFDEITHSAITRLNDASGILFVCLTAAFLGAGYVKYIVGPPWVRDAIRNVLMAFRDDAFRTGDDPLEHHNVTLFKCARGQFRSLFVWRSRLWPWGRGAWPWSQWLVPVMGTGSFGSMQSAVVLAHEGVAGKAFQDGQEIEILELPDLNDSMNSLGPSEVDAKVDKYVNATGLHRQFVQRQRNASRKLPVEYVAFRIEVAGSPWGVLVLDSVKPGGIKRTAEPRAARNSMIRSFLAEMLLRL